MSMLGALFIVFALAVINALIGVARICFFLSSTTSLETEADLERFKALARTQMWQSLLQIVFLIAGGGLGFYALIVHKVGLLWLLLLNGAIIAVSLPGRTFERKVMALPVDDTLEASYRAICHCWVHKPFPDF